MRRRDVLFGAVVGAALPASQVDAQAAPSQAAPDQDLLKEKKESVRQNAAELHAFSIKISTEPAFAFKA